MEDESGHDAKILALPIDKLCMEYRLIKQMDQLPETLLQSIQHFFEHYKDLEPSKWVKVTGWEGVASAQSELEESIARYKE